MFEAQNEISKVVTDLMAAVRERFSNEGVFAIKTQQDYDYATTSLQLMKADVKVVVAERDSLTRPLNDEKGRIIAEFKPFQEECADIESRFKRGMNAYLDERERIRREKQAKEEETARKAQARLLKRSDQAADKGHDEKSQELQAQAFATAPKHVEEVSKGNGVSRRTVWKTTAIDMKLAKQTLANNPAWLAYLNIDFGKLDKLAQSLGEEFDIPGIKATPTQSMAVRS